MTEYNGLERSSATDELRRMLDEHGMEWMPSAWSANDETFYKVGEVGYLATELSSERMKVRIEGYPTPAQAVEATLGRGTCHESMIDKFFRGCSECGYMWEYMYRIGSCTRPNYCPNCGKKVAS